MKLHCLYNIFMSVVLKYETYHKPVYLSLFKIICFVVQSDLITLALISINLEGDICIGSCTGQV